MLFTIAFISKGSHDDWAVSSTNVQHPSDEWRNDTKWQDKLKALEIAADKAKKDVPKVPEIAVIKEKQDTPNAPESAPAQQEQPVAIWKDIEKFKRDRAQYYRERRISE